MSYVEVKLTEDQAKAIIRILDYGKAEKRMDYTLNRMVWDAPEDAQYNAFLTRIQQKLYKKLFGPEAKYED